MLAVFVVIPFKRHSSGVFLFVFAFAQNSGRQTIALAGGLL